jgi:hypothetical protein
MSDEHALDSFGPLATVPAVHVVLPTGRAQLDGDAVGGTAESARVPGGVVLVVHGPSTGWFPGTMLTAIDHDGTLRWVRCRPDDVTRVVVAPADLQPTRALVETLVYDDQAQPSLRWDIISLTDGTIERPVADVIAAAGLAALAAPPTRLVTEGAGLAVLGPDEGHVVDVAVDRLVVLDLVTMTVARTIPFPAEFQGHLAYELQIEITPAGQLLRMGTVGDGLTHRGPNEVEVDGTWVTDPAELRQAWPVTAWYAFGEGFPTLEAYDATGTIRWRRADVVARVTEGFTSGVDGDVVVALSCKPPMSDTADCRYRLGGYSLADGHTIWQLDGRHLVSAIGDGTAMISTLTADGTGVAGWTLISTRTGRALAADQTWADPFAFDYECCGGDETTRVTRHGGILAVFSPGVVDIWYPRTAGHPTVTITLP